MNSIDTIYEYAGLKLAGALWNTFSSVGLPLIVALAGLAYAVHSVADRGSIRPLAVHLMYLILAAGMLGSTTQQGVKTPRFVAFLGQATDLLQKRAVRQINDKFLTEPFEWERIAARVSSARLLDPVLERDVGLFLESCGRTTLARAEPRHGNLLRDGALPYEGSCEDRRRKLWMRVQSHVKGDSHHRATLDAARTKNPSEAPAFVERYTDELIVRAIDEPGGPVSEGALVRAALGEYSYTDPAQSTGALPAWAKAALGPIAFWIGDQAANLAITGAAELNQTWENKFSAKQKFFLVVTYGPHLYGLALMVLLGLFPVAGLFALCPNQWMMFVRYAKTLISVKLWPVGWSLLSTFNERRAVLETFDDPGRVDGSPFLAAAAMYLVVPGVMFLIVHVAANAAALPFAPAVPPPAGPGLGPVAPAAASAAARMAR